MGSFGTLDWYSTPNNLTLQRCAVTLVGKLSKQLKSQTSFAANIDLLDFTRSSPSLRTNQSKSRIL